MTHKSNDSFFDSMQQYLKPITELPQNHDRIVTIDYEQTIDKIIVILGLSWHHIGNHVNRTSVIVIEHDDFRNWLEANDKLILMFGAHDDIEAVEVDYSEYMTDHVQRSDIQEYIIEKKLAPTYVWSI